MKRKEYALYKGEELLAIGTVKELAIKFGIKEKTIYFYKSPAHLRRRKLKSNTGNYKVVVCLEE